MQKEKIRILWAREHTTIFKGMGVFLAGPTPHEDLKNGWRRVVVDALKNDERLCPHMTVVCPEPEEADWSTIIDKSGGPIYNNAVNQQVEWELQYLNACDLTAFWMPTYWKAETSGPFEANIGVTTRWEFGYYFSRWEHNPHRYDLILGAPNDADKLNWPRKKAKSNKLRWHSLKTKDKELMVPQSFIDEIAEKLITNKWCGCN